MTFTRFSKFAWFVMVFNIGVVLWGVAVTFQRNNLASKKAL